MPSRRRHLSISSWKLEWFMKYWWDCNIRRWESVEFRKQKQLKSLSTTVQEKNDTVNVEHHIQFLESCALEESKSSVQSLHISFVISPTLVTSFTDICWWLSKQAPDLLDIATWIAHRRYTIHKSKTKFSAFSSMTKIWSFFSLNYHSQSFKFC